MLTAGVPDRLDYRGWRQRPFFRVLEGLCVLINSRKDNVEYKKLVAMQRCCLQGWPPRDFNAEAVNRLEAEAQAAVKDVAAAMFPWRKVEESKEATLKDLAASKDGMIKLWKAYFEPEAADSGTGGSLVTVDDTAGGS